MSNTNTENATQKIKRPFYASKGFVIISVLFFFPLGLFLLWKYGDFRLPSKIIITAILTVLLAIGFYLTFQEVEQYGYLGFYDEDYGVMNDGTEDEYFYLELIDYDEMSTITDQQFNKYLASIDEYIDIHHFSIVLWDEHRTLEFPNGNTGYFLYGVTTKNKTASPAIKVTIDQNFSFTEFVQNIDDYERKLKSLE